MNFIMNSKDFRKIKRFLKILILTILYKESKKEVINISKNKFYKYLILKNFKNKLQYQMTKNYNYVRNFIMNSKDFQKLEKFIKILKQATLYYL